jgi:hypothetical protein
MLLVVMLFVAAEPATRPSAELHVTTPGLSVSARPLDAPASLPGPACVSPCTLQLPPGRARVFWNDEDYPKQSTVMNLRAAHTEAALPLWRHKDVFFAGMGLTIAGSVVYSAGQAWQTATTVINVLNARGVDVARMNPYYPWILIGTGGAAVVTGVVLMIVYRKPKPLIVQW